MRCGLEDFIGGDHAQTVERGHKALRDYADKAHGDIGGSLFAKSFRKLIDDALDSQDGVGSMDGGNDKMPGEGRAEGGLHGVEIAHFSNDNHIGSLAEDILQGGGEGRSVTPDLTLGDEAFPVLMDKFDRVLNGDNMGFARLVDEVYDGAHGCGLAAPCAA